LTRQKTLKGLGRTLVTYARHPRKVTCLNCGFLSFGEDTEVSTADRILLHAVKESPKLPPVDELCCSRKSWVDYDLIYGATDTGGIIDEIQKDRRDCQAFFRYWPGWSPSGHRDLLLKAFEKRQKVFFTVLGVFLGALGSLLTRLGDWVAKGLGLW